MRNDTCTPLNMMVRRTMVFGIAVACAGCVLNPYVRTTGIAEIDGEGRVSGISFEKRSCDKNKDADQKTAIAYAACIRQEMAKKAGSYAVMNNGGGALLLGLTGFAGYRGIRGGHKAQVAALTTGGAALYGTQQYLYRKPREGTYWQGASAMDCAIGVTMRKKVAGQGIAQMRKEYDSAQVPDFSGARTVLQALSSEGCSTEVKDEFDALSTALGRLAGADREALLVRRNQIEARLARLETAGDEADVRLIEAADGIRDAVNRQLAAEEPNPAELKKLIADLKLPSLSGAQTSASASGSDKGSSTLVLAEANGNYLSIFGLKHPLFSFADSADKSCSLGGKLEELRKQVDAMKVQVVTLQRTFESLEASLSRAEAQMGEAKDGREPIQTCTLGMTDPLQPFGLAFVSEGAQIAKQGATLKVAITGGRAPYELRQLSDDGHGLQANIVAGEGGAVAVAVVVPADTKVDTRVSWLIRDAVGASEVLQVKVAK